MSHETKLQIKRQTQPVNLETDVTDITIAPDGRIYCFGLSRQVLALLCESGLMDERLRNRWMLMEEYHSQET